MSTDQNATSSPYRRGPWTPRHEPADGCMDSRVRENDAACEKRETAGPADDAGAVSAPQDLAPWRHDGAVVSEPEGLTPAPTSALARLMIWLSPGYPVGGFSYSHGLEWTVEAGKVCDAATLGGWIEDILRHGAGRSDAIFLAETWRAVTCGDDLLLAQAMELS